MYDTWVDLCIERDAARARSDPTRPVIGRELIAGWGDQYRDVFLHSTRYAAVPMSALLEEKLT